MLLTPTDQRHEKFANVARKKKTCHDMSVSVSVWLNFKMLRHTTFPTKHNIMGCVVSKTIISNFLNWFKLVQGGFVMCYMKNMTATLTKES